MANEIVCMENVHRYYSEKPDLLAKYREIEASGKCPFCSPNIENPLIFETLCWRAVNNQFPYQNTRRHLLLLPKRHIVDLAQMSPQEWMEMGNVLAAAVAEMPRLVEGYGLALRMAEIGGVTLHHLHWHLIVPEVGMNGPFPVDFKIG